MAENFFIKQDNRLPVIRAQFTDATGYVDLTSATVHFVYRYRSRVTGALSGQATIVTATSGIVEYAWTTGDVVNAGNYYGEFRAKLSNNKEITFPNDNYLRFMITDKLG